MIDIDTQETLIMIQRNFEQIDLLAGNTKQLLSLLLRKSIDVMDVPEVRSVAKRTDSSRLILDYARSHGGTIHVADFRREMKGEVNPSFLTTTIYTKIKAMVKDGLLKKDSIGVYSLSAKAKAAGG